MPAAPPLREQALVFREFATLIGAGISLLQALDQIQQRPLSQPFRMFLRNAQSSVSKGQRLSVVMRSQPGMFSELSLALIEAGEEGGRLEEMLKDVATYLEQELELRRLIARETFYPKILLLACLFIPLGANCVIAAVKDSPAGAFVMLAKGLVLYAIFGGLPVLAVYVVYRQFTASETGKKSIDAMKLRIPLVGGIVERLALLKFARALSALYGAGVHYPKAIGLSGDACGNRHIAEIIRTAVPHVEKGSILSEALLQTRLGRSLLLRLLQTGEQTGNIDTMMDKAAQHYADESETQIRRLTVAIVPVAVVIAGGVVCVMLARMYMGYFTDLLDAGGK